MKQNRWMYLGGIYGACWAVILPIVTIGFAVGAVKIFLKGNGRGPLFLMLSMLGVSVFLATFTIAFRNQFYSWVKLGKDGLFLRIAFSRKKYQRYDRFRDAGICRYVHGDVDDPHTRRLDWIYLSVEPLRPLYVRNIYRMPISAQALRMPYNEKNLDRLLLLLPGELADKIRMDRAKMDLQKEEKP
ncbi:MAG: hypothetical protein IKU11_07590 [Clostridia bacterium]|nr:hypothetical protein [Clostridia bacterium]